MGRDAVSTAPSRTKWGIDDVFPIIHNPYYDY